MSIDRLYDSTQSISLSFWAYLFATLLIGAIAFTDLSEKIKKYLADHGEG